MGRLVLGVVIWSNHQNSDKLNALFVCLYGKLVILCCCRCSSNTVDAQQLSCPYRLLDKNGNSCAHKSVVLDAG